MVHTVTPKVSRHGKACVNCARAKVKCVEKNAVDIDACERCHRLGKVCQSITRTKRRKPVKKTTAAKTAELEQKLDDLVSLLTAANKAQNTPSSTAPDQDESSDPKKNTQSLGYQGGPNFCNLNPPVRGLEAVGIKLPANGPYSGRSIPIDPPLADLPHQALGKEFRDISTDYCAASHIPSAIQPISLIPSHLELSSTEAENALDHFRNHSTKYLPFMVIPPDTNVHEFRKGNPFWWLAIAMATAKTTSRQITLGMHIRQLLGQKLLVLGERNLDLLWGLLTYIAWSQCHYQQRPVWSSMIQLAMGLVYDLGLNKAPPKEAPHLFMNFDARGCPKPFLPSIGSRQEKRALLCLFSLSSSFSIYVQKIDTLRWTPYAEESAKILSENPESDHDTLMVQIVRLQLIQERVKDAPWYDTTSDSNTAFRAPAMFYLKALKSQMENFKQQIPDKVRANHTLLMHLYNTELTIHEIALSKEPISDLADFQRLESLCICFQCIKSWFDIYFSLPCRENTSFVFTIYTHLAHCMVGLYRLSVFEDPQWDVQLVRQQLDLSFVLDQIVKTWENVKDAAGLDEGMTRVDDVDIYTTNAKRIGLIKTWWDAKVAAETSRSVPGEKFANEDGDAGMDTEPMAQAQSQGLEIPTLGVDMGQEIWDEGWWQDVFGAWCTHGDMMTVPATTYF
ncbi:hypothetical protein DSL72_000931 [Monilinia vaccinii-corymbosi]|uniref:Zn(2)-C6 fungal-type domain-containing protein n=1 Tax=Monilinia vaccinii-corymbosi TaxID=61207 RepID=A0A8A3P6N8_9HELO|nr:hypothetical protein DSL72_000931 [Monilinia vaccinii-corymbosi]